GQHLVGERHLEERVPAHLDGGAAALLDRGVHVVDRVARDALAGQLEDHAVLASVVAHADLAHDEFGAVDALAGLLALGRRVCGSRRRVGGLGLSRRQCPGLRGRGGSRGGRLARRRGRGIRGVGPAPREGQGGRSGECGGSGEAAISEAHASSVKPIYHFCPTRWLQLHLADAWGTMGTWLISTPHSILTGVPSSPRTNRSPAPPRTSRPGCSWRSPEDGGATSSTARRWARTSPGGSSRTSRPTGPACSSSVGPAARG